MSKDILLNLIEKVSPSGLEREVQQYLAKTYKSDFNKFEVSEKGVLTCTYNENSDFSIMLAAHADEISLIVDGYNSNGSLKVNKNGGVRSMLYQGTKVKVILENGKILNGVMGVNDFAKEVKIDDCFVDCGFFSEKEARENVPLGSYVVHDTDTRELQNNLISGRAFDDRACDYIIHEAAKRAYELGSKNKIYVTTTTGEENTGRGAYQASETYKPNIFVAVDVTYATDYSQCDERGEVELRKGGAICNGSITNRKLNQLLRDCAKELNLPVQEEVFAGRTGTDGDTALKTNNGPIIVLFSLPLRYMHSPAEVISYDDVESMIKVLALFLVKVSKEMDFAPFEI